LLLDDVDHIQINVKYPLFLTRNPAESVFKEL